MKVLVMTTWENPKSDEGQKKYYEYMNKHGQYWTERAKKYNVKASSWSDGTGKMYGLREFESYDAYARYFDDEEFQKSMIHFFRTVKNVEMKVLREPIMAPP